MGIRDRSILKFPAFVFFRSQNNVPYATVKTGEAKQNICHFGRYFFTSQIKCYNSCPAVFTNIIFVAYPR